MEFIYQIQAILLIFFKFSICFRLSPCFNEGRSYIQMSLDLMIYANNVVSVIYPLFFSKFPMNVFIFLGANSYAIAEFLFDLLQFRGY